MGEATGPARVVRHFRQALLWTLRLTPLRERKQISRHWKLLGEPWSRVSDEIGDPAAFQERHYREFVSFLPYVQRLLYGDAGPTGAGSPIRVFRRRDVAAVRVMFDGLEAPVDFEVVHVDLYFFYDIDVVILNLEIAASDLPLGVVQETLFRLGRAFPAGWDAAGRAMHCPRRVEFLSAEGAVLAASDYDERERFLDFACRRRAPAFAAHWEFLLRPMVPEHGDAAGPLRYRLLEDYRIPLLAYLAMAEPGALTRAQYARLAFNTGPGEDPENLPYSEGFLADFEQRHCYDRFHDPARKDWVDARLIATSRVFLMIGSARDAMFTDPERGLLGQFRHQYFLLYLIARFHKGALLMLSDRLTITMNRLDIHDPESVRRFKREIRRLMEIFLRFTHRYWFHELSDQTQAREIFRMHARQLGSETLYEEVREEIEAMARYLDSDSLRRQANTILRLTVVTIFALVGTVTTGFLGMNIFAMAELPAVEKIVYFVACFGLLSVLTAYTIVKSKRLSDFLDALSDERLSWRQKGLALLGVWWRPAA
jgi:hypothetical protein